MKKILILLSIIFLMSGCYDYVEIDDLVIVTGILIDYNDNQYEVTSEVIENEKESKVKVFTTKCTTIDECIYNFGISDKKTQKNNEEKIGKELGYLSKGKLHQNEGIEKRMVLVSISRKLFTHSLPLIVAEQCYVKLLKDTRSLIVDTKIIKKQEKAYALLIKLIEEYNVKLLSTKIYWDKPEKKEVYKEFWKKFQKLQEIKETDPDEYEKQKEILFIKADLKQVMQNENKYYKIIIFYKEKLVEFGVMKKLKNCCKSEGNYIGRKILCKKL